MTCSVLMGAAFGLVNLLSLVVMGAAFGLIKFGIFSSYGGCIWAS